MVEYTGYTNFFDQFNETKVVNWVKSEIGLNDTPSDPNDIFLGHIEFKITLKIEEIKK